MTYLHADLSGTGQWWPTCMLTSAVLVSDDLPACWSQRYWSAMTYLHVDLSSTCQRWPTCMLTSAVPVSDDLPACWPQQYLSAMTYLLVDLSSTCQRWPTCLLTSAVPVSDDLPACWPQARCSCCTGQWCTGHAPWSGRWPRRPTTEPGSRPCRTGDLRTAPSYWSTKFSSSENTVKLWSRSV